MPTADAWKAFLNSSTEPHLALIASASAPVASGAAYAAGQSLGWSTANTNLGAIVTGTTANAHAFPISAVASGSTTADVVIHLPRAVVVP